MACSSMRKPNQTVPERDAEIKAALRRLEAALQAGQVTVAISPQGAVAFGAWSDRDGVTDACAYRTLAAAGSWALRQAVARAEALGGRKVNERAVLAGTHSHDGGKTWHHGH
jgi:hypothetical protein